MAEKIPTVRGLNAVNKSESVSEKREERVAFVSGARILFLALLVATAVLARDMLMMIFLSVMIAFALSYPVGLMSRKLPRGLAVILSLVLVLGALTGFGVAMAPVLSKQVHSVRKTLPSAVQQFENWAGKAGQAGQSVQPGQKDAQTPANAQPGKAQDQLEDHVSKLIDSGMGKIFPAALGAISGVSGAILILVLAAFLVHQPEVYVKGARLLVPKKSESAYDEGTRRIASGLRRWIGGIGLAMLVMGLCTAVGLKIAGIDNWLLLGVLTALGTFIPYLGAVCSAVPGVLMGLSQSPHHFFYACIVYLCVHIIEGYIVQPYIMKRAVEVRPALLLVGQAIFGELLGLPGVVVASPLLVCLQIAVEYYYVERKLGKKAEI
jgi:predicted PurR-regulated permease PerM